MHAHLLEMQFSIISQMKDELSTDCDHDYSSTVLLHAAELAELDNVQFASFENQVLTLLSLIQMPFKSDLLGSSDHSE